MMLGQTIVARACSLLSQLALAAILVPADFGLVGLAYTVTTIATTVTAIGVEDVVMQRKRALHLWCGPVFWINFGLAVIAGGIVFAVAPFAALFYRAPQMTGLLGILALSMPLSALAAVPTLIMRSAMKFPLIAIFGSIEIVAQAVMTVVLAKLGYGAFSFVLPVPLIAGLHAILWWLLMPWRPRLRVNYRRWRFLVGNTSAAFVSRLLIALIGQGDYMVLGFLAGEHVVGAYYFAFRLAAQPLWMLAGNLASVLYPALIEMKSDPVRQGYAALKAATLLAYCVMPVAFLQAAVAAPMLHSLFGHKWVMSIPLIPPLSVGLALDAMSWVAGALLAARGEFKLGLRYVVVQVPVFFAMVVTGAAVDQAVGVAWAVCLFYAVTQPAFVFGVYRRFGLSLQKVLAIYLKPTAFAALSVGMAAVISRESIFRQNLILEMSLLCVLSALSYGFLMKLFASDVWEVLTSRAMSKLKQKLSGTSRA